VIVCATITAAIATFVVGLRLITRARILNFVGKDDLVHRDCSGETSPDQAIPVHQANSRGIVFLNLQQCSNVSR